MPFWLHSEFLSFLGPFPLCASFPFSPLTFFLCPVSPEGGPRDAAQYLFSVTLVLTQGGINDLKQRKAR